MACGSRGSTPLWAGEASWFCCGNSWGPCASTGGGSCGTCRSGEPQAAWPHASRECWEITRPDLCGEDIPKRGCGSVLTVRHQCSDASVCVTITDCGPRTKSFCSEKTCCDGVCRTNRVIDLTPAAFSALGSLSSGTLPVLIDE
ncbi:septal ring lytic transglycosylase RlpA family protein [Streptomyces sp. NPDC059679]|uniref:septal ring lytic transglycosylase RlpA family protein n=1 Tax=Streptomyces sp. NPDC059679 TaxID=3346903 RepID=UPI0036C8EA50